MRPVVCVRPVGEFGYEWVNAPFAKISDGVPIVMDNESEELLAHE